MEFGTGSGIRTRMAQGRLILSQMSLTNFSTPALCAERTRHDGLYWSVAAHDTLGKVLCHSQADQT